jgi:hypothetical protein
MSLIEHLDKPGGEEFLRSTFEHVLWVLRNDRFRSVGSAADDLRSWLAAGGVARVRHHLDEQMERGRFPSSRRSAVNACIERLVRENRAALLDLARTGIVPVAGRERFDLPEVSASEVEELLGRMLAGERPFEEWMYAHGRSGEEIAEVYRWVDEWLMKAGPRASATGYRR